MDDDKAKSAKERLDAAKRAAEEAEIIDEAKKPATPGETDSAPEDAVAGNTAADDEIAPDADRNAATEDDTASETAEDRTREDDETPPSEDDDRRAEEEARAVEDEMLDRNDHAEDEDHDEEAHHENRPLSATILTWLGVLVVGMAIALWAGPRIAPNLPGWAAPVAAFLTPGRNQADARIDALEAELAAKTAALSARLEEVAETADDAALAKLGTEENLRVAADNALLEKIEEVAAGPRADVARLDDLATRLAKTETQIAGLRRQVEELAGMTGENAAPSAETLKRVAAFGAAVEGLRAEVAAALEQTAKVETKADGRLVEDLAARVAALEAGASAQTEAAEVRRGADLDVALARIGAALKTGRPFADDLDDIAAISDAPPPEALTAVAGGARTMEDLLLAFPKAAQAGYAAALEAEAGEGFAARTLAKLQGRYGGRPSVETAGDDVGAVLSRIEARMEDGAQDEALEEAAGLPETARAAMAGWLNDLDALAQAEAALAALRARAGQ